MVLLYQNRGWLSSPYATTLRRMKVSRRRREAWQVAYTVTVVATAVLGVVTALGMIFAPAVVRVVAPGFSDDPQIVALTVHLMRLMFPTVVILGIAGVFMGILNSYNHFTLPAVAPIVWNVVIIGVVVAFSAGYGFKALAWGVLAGTAVELLLQVPAVWKRRWRPRNMFTWRSPWPSTCRGPSASSRPARR
jgi:putative peptidoglycan lipid II flippase